MADSIRMAVDYHKERVVTTLEATPMQDWLDLIARPSPIWAGGSVLAVTCAQAWALLAMIAGLAYKRDRIPGLLDVVERAKLAQSQLLELSEHDATALRQALQKDAPPAAIQAVTEVPLEILRWSIEGARTALHRNLIQYRPAQFDLKAARALFFTASQALSELVQENARLLPGDSEKALLDRLSELMN